MRILTPNGYVDRNKLKVGDYVLSGELKPIKILVLNDEAISLEYPHTYFLDGKLTHNVPNITQQAYQLYYDGTPSTNVARFGLSNIGYWEPGLNCGLRISAWTSSAGWNPAFTLQYKTGTGAGAYSNVPTSLAGNDVAVVDTPSFSDSTPCSQRITYAQDPFAASATYSYTAGKCRDTGITVTTMLSAGSNMMTENYWNIKFSNSALGKVFQFIQQSVSGIYTVVPTIYVGANNLRIRDGQNLIVRMQ